MIYKITLSNSEKNCLDVLNLGLLGILKLVRFFYTITSIIFKILKKIY